MLTTLTASVAAISTTGDAVVVAVATRIVMPAAIDTAAIVIVVSIDALVVVTIRAVVVVNVTTQITDPAGRMTNTFSRLTIRMVACTNHL